MYRNDRDDSPDYRPPPGPSSRRRARSPLSPSYSPLRDRGYHDRRCSPSPRGHDSYKRREPTPDKWRSDSRDYKRPRSRSRSAGTSSRSPTRDQKLSSFLAPYEDDLKSLYCKQCQISFNDRESMVGHLKGSSHQMQLRRLKDHEIRNKTGKSLNDNLVPTYDDYDKDFWNQNKGARKLRPEQERFLDTKRLDNVPAKFNRERYDNGQYKFNANELHCEVCDVWVRSRDQMQAHKEGANHKKKSAKVQRFRCQLCLIEVPCQDTLNNHMRGKDHIKREKQLAEQRKQRGDLNAEENDSGYKVGPMEMAKLKDDQEEENKRLRLEVQNLRAKLVEYQGKHRKCVREHGKMDDYQKYKQYYLDNHVRPEQLARSGIHIKKEEPLDSAITSGSGRAKEEPRVKREQERGVDSDNEYMEHMDNEIIVIQSPYK